MTIEIQPAQSLKRFNTLGFDVRAEHLVVASSEADVAEALSLASARDWPVTVLGGGSNVVLMKDVPGLVLVVGIPGILFDDCRVEAGAGEGWHTLVLATIEHGLAGLENLALIPGSAGAAPIQNIGAYGVELESVFRSARAIDRHTLEIVEFSRRDCEFGYRDSIFKRQARNRFVITSITLSLSRTFEPELGYADLERELGDSRETLTPALVAETVAAIRGRKLPSPERIGNAGSFFKNPVLDNARLERIVARYPEVPQWPVSDGTKVSAGWLIEQCGLKGLREGGAAVFDGHALVLVNEGKATPADVMALAARVREAVQRRFGVELEIEPTLLP